MKSLIEGGSGIGASSSTPAGSTAAERRTASSPAARRSSPSRSTSRSAPVTGKSSAPRQTPTRLAPSDVLKVLQRTCRPRSSADLGSQLLGRRRHGCELAARDLAGQGEPAAVGGEVDRSEERRVGKEWG